MTLIDRLFDVSGGFIELDVDTGTLANDALQWQEAGLTVRAVRGAKMRTLPALFDEFSAALQFPYYFGKNWAAFEDCISDLDWLPRESGIVVVVYDGDQVLTDADSHELPTLVRALDSARNEFAAPVRDGEWWDRGPIPFHVVLQGGDLSRWRRAGVGARGDRS